MISTAKSTGKQNEPQVLLIDIFDNARAAKALKHLISDHADTGPYGRVDILEYIAQKARALSGHQRDLVSVRRRDIWTTRYRFLANKVTRYWVTSSEPCNAQVSCAPSRHFWQASAGSRRPFAGRVLQEWDEGLRTSFKIKVTNGTSGHPYSNADGCEYHSDKQIYNRYECISFY